MTETEIVDVRAREILDNRLEPTLRVTVETPAGSGTADVPAGRSRGTREAVESRDGGDRYRGRGVQTAVSTVENRIEPDLRGRSITDQRGIDETLVTMDGTGNMSDLGGNTATGVSLACLKAGGRATGRPLYRYVGGATVAQLPVPFLDMIEGGELSGSDLPFQEHQLVPVGADSFGAAIRMGAEVYYELGDMLAESHGQASRNVGDEGGYNPVEMAEPREAFECLWAAVEELGYQDSFALAADVAATHFYDPETDCYELSDERLGRDDLLSLYEELIGAYPIVSLEDPLHEEDFAGFAELTDRLDVQVIGDDLFVTDSHRVERGVERGAANALLLKVNQVGTVTEASEAARLATRNGYALQVSERSGQTPDTWLADLTVGLGAGQIKTGVTRGERTEQYNRLLAIEDELGASATYGGGVLAHP